MKRRTGYLINIENPNFSGIATLTFCSARPRVNKPAPGIAKFEARGKITRVYTESGSGVRALAAALGRHFEYAGPKTKLAYIVDASNLLAYFEAL